MQNVRLAGAVLIATLAAAPATAQAPKESYVARISVRDHYNSNGSRLHNVASILRQDRANVHRYGVRDREDQTDGFFVVARNREQMERLLRRGSTPARAQNAIIDGTPLVRVDIHEGYISVTLLGD